MSPHHFTQEDRIKLEAFLEAGLSQKAISELLGFHPASISREIKRNSVSGKYRARKAQERAEFRRKEIERTHKWDYEKLRRYVIDKTIEGWSPEQISGRLPIDFPDDPKMRISHETIYLTAYADERWGDLLTPYWRLHRKKRKKRGSAYKNRAPIKGRVSIEKRPDEINQRTRTGDLEGDTVHGAGQSGSITTLVDRKSLFLWAAWVPTRHADVVAKSIVNLLMPFKGKTLHSITFDNGSEFANHQDIADTLGINTYFARPYRSNDRARNENTNGLLRQYFPKKMRFDTITDEQLQRAVEELNHRPRKTLNYRTPAEVLFNSIIAFQPGYVKKFL